MYKKTVKELLGIAKEIGVVGRHEMKKDELIEAIKRTQVKPSVAVEIQVVTPDKTFEDELVDEASVIANEWGDVPQTKQLPRKVDYVENAKVGQIVAFRVNDVKTLSGKVTEIHQAHFAVITKNGIKFSVAKHDVIWVKTTDRWPKGVYLALKGEAGPNENKRPGYKSIQG